jgi:protein arginine kinase activator
MRCELCQENPASVYVTDLTPTPETPHGELGEISLRHMCSSCAADLNLPHGPVPGQNKAMLFKLLQKTAKASKQPVGPICSCGMTLHELRAQGRLGCQECYQVFRPHLVPLFLRMHQATEHTGRAPGTDVAQVERTVRIEKLRERMDMAIREEEYEDAARLRDELTQLEAETSK